jgi:hypothetical protein
LCCGFVFVRRGSELVALVGDRIELGQYLHFARAGRPRSNLGAQLLLRRGRFLEPRGEDFLAGARSEQFRIRAELLVLAPQCRLALAAPRRVPLELHHGVLERLDLLLHRRSVLGRRRPESVALPPYRFAVLAEPLAIGFGGRQPVAQRRLRGGIHRRRWGRRWLRDGLTQATLNAIFKPFRGA